MRADHRGWSVLLLTCASLVGACAHRSVTPEPAGSARIIQESDTPRPEPMQSGLMEAWNGKHCQFSPVYFDFDSAQIDQAGREALIGAATCYMNSVLPERLVITGATDPRGTEEYNLALGHRRATAVGKLLGTLGIPAQRITTTSVGEERAAGRDEGGYRLDRYVATTEQ